MAWLLSFLSSCFAQTFLARIANGIAPLQTAACNPNLARQLSGARTMGVDESLVRKAMKARKDYILKNLE